MQNIVKKPLITEKTLSLAAKGFYTFEVAKDSNKAEIARDVAELYQVKVVNVRSVSLPGKTRRVGRKLTTIRKADWKKAIVQLAQGQKIEAFAVTTEGEKK